MTTTTTTTTVILLTSSQAGLALGIVGTILLILALIIRELTSAYVGYPDLTWKERVRVTFRRERIKALSKNVLVAIVPLLLIFILIVVTEVSDILAT